MTDKIYPGCGHSPKWLITYDIGRNNTEQIFVCDACYEDPDNDSFRVYVISRKILDGRC